MASSTARKILIAMDGSKQPEYALRYFKEHVHKDGDEVIIVYAAEHGGLAVQPMFTSDPANVASLAGEEEKEVKKRLEKISKILSDIGLQGKVMRYSANTPGEAVIKAAEELAADLIITGTRGLGTIRRTIMGSVSQYIVHHSHVPVLVCRDK